MSKIKPIVSDLAKQLYKKSVRQLFPFSLSLGLCKGKKKAQIIQHLVTIAEKDESVKQRITKFLTPLQKTTPSIATQQQSTQNPSQSDKRNIQTENINIACQILTNVQLNNEQIELHSKILQKYCNLFDKTPVAQVIKNQMVPFSSQYVRTILDRDHKQKNDQIEKKGIKEQIPLSKYVSKFGSKLRKNLYLTNDIQKNEQTQESEFYTNFLNSLHIQRQLIFPTYLIQKTYQMTTMNLIKNMAGLDLKSLNEYIQNQLQQRIKILAKKNDNKEKIYTLSQALPYMHMIKEQSYNKIDYIINLVRELSMEGGTTKRLYFKNQNQFFNDFDKHTQYYQSIFAAAGKEVRIRLILGIIQITETEIQGQQIIPFEQIRLLNLAVKLCKIDFELFQEHQNVQGKLHLCKKIISIWMKYSEKQSIYNSEQLHRLLQGLKTIDQLVQTLQSKCPQQKITQIYQSCPEYQNITKQIFYSLQNILQENASSTIIQSNVLNSIINNFSAIYCQSSIPTDLIFKCVMYGCNLSQKLENRTRRSLVRLLANREVINSQVVPRQAVYYLLQLTVDFDVKELLLAVQLVKNYQLINNDQLLRNLILLNIDPPQLEQTTKTYLKKIVQQRIQQESIQKQILTYLQ